uniref:interferon alpha/beta receptor 2-like isoform X3 n=1 Tax=Scatophagus argus TaxID=75038 RepID=UPI001ED86287|nr:interferon alpha/beta receptor 2-like isoform X3 [Scatophagus argus]
MRRETASHSTVHGGKMGLWTVLVLLTAQLGNAPMDGVVSVSLPAPTNVSITSFNMEHTLSFLPGPETPSSARFAVEILQFRRNSWQQVAGCLELTAGQTCSLTQAFNETFDEYEARVQAFTPNQTSKWTASKRFQPLADTVLGPPDLSVSGCGNCLLLKFKAPTTKGLQQLRDHHVDLVIQVKRTRDGVQFTLSQPYKEEVTITYLQPGVEYCVSVSLKTLFNFKSVTGEAHCAFTSPPQPTDSRTSHLLHSDTANQTLTVYVVYSLLAVFSVLGCLLGGLVVYSTRPSFRLVRPWLSRRRSYLFLGGQSPERAPPERSGQISTTQLHEGDSAECLLPAHRPAEALSISSDEGQDG